MESIKLRAKEIGIPFKAAYPGQTIHAALVSMKRSGLVFMHEAGVWQIVKDDASLEQSSEAS